MDIYINISIYLSTYLWRGQWGKSTYKAKWMQEIERHLGGRESSILKQDERKKLVGNMPPPTCTSLAAPGDMRAQGLFEMFQ